MKETRTYNGRIEWRADDTNSRRVVGHAAVFDQLSQDMGWRESWYEVIDRGAFDDVLNNDVRALFNHDPNYVLARTASGTLSISVDATGLRYEFDAPNTTAGNDLIELIKRGDISQSSFAFTVAEQAWVEVDGQAPVRHIKRVKQLFDVSPVTYPAYEGTDVAKRSLDELHNRSEDEAEAERKAAEAKAKAVEAEVELLSDLIDKQTKLDN